MALPGFGILASILGATDVEATGKAIHAALHPIGEFAARFMIIAMLASPLALVLKCRVALNCEMRNPTKSTVTLCP